MCKRGRPIEEYIGPAELAFNDTGTLRKAIISDDTVQQFYVYEDGTITRKNSSGEWIVKPYILNEYYYAQIKVAGKWKTVAVHRLVAEAFVPRQNLAFQVNHKNENKLDNRADNLEWLSQRDNIIYSIKLHKGDPNWRKQRKHNKKNTH